MSSMLWLTQQPHPAGQYYRPAVRPSCPHSQAFDNAECERENYCTHVVQDNTFVKRNTHRRYNTK